MSRAPNIFNQIPDFFQNVILSSEFESNLNSCLVTCHFVGPSGLRALHETNCPLLTAFFLSHLLSAFANFLPEGVGVGF